LSKEMQAYYEKITAVLLRPDAAARRVVYGSLRADAGLHQLVPYLVQFMADKVRQGGGAHDPARLMRAAGAHRARYR
jgi:hypothetical protein